MRRPAARTKPRIARMQSFPAPVNGWIRNINLATPDARLPDGRKVNGAAMLVNWFPMATGIRMRGGTDYYAQLDGGPDLEALFTYVNGNNRSLFAATHDSIFDISSSVFSFLVDEDDNTLVDDLGNALIDSSLTATVNGFTSGKWSTAQFATTGGVFLDLVNGSDNKLIYDGANFYPVTDQDLTALNYDGGTVAFTVGQVLTGGTSAATGTVVKVIGDAVAGTLWLSGTADAFQNDEVITDGLGGAAVADGSNPLLFGKLTGIETNKLSHNWVYKNRLFYVEKDSLNFWYLPVDSITGAATKFSMGGIFPLGGSLLFGASWSIESGDGLSEQCAFFSTEGEVAVFQGPDPSDAAKWSKVGVYRIGNPRGPKAFIRAGGDLVIATDIGFVPLSIATQRDIAALSPSAISYPIEVAWNDTIRERSFADWNCIVWPTKQMVLVAPPTRADQEKQVLVANARTGAWSLFTGLDVTCFALFDDRLFFGSKNGVVAEMEVTGSDLGSPYVATVVPLFDPLKNPASLKNGLLARSTIRATSDVRVKLSLQADHDIRLPAPPDDISVAVGSVWGGAQWGQGVWGTKAVKTTISDWQSVGGTGYALSIAAQTTSGSASAPDVEYVQTELTYDMGDIVT